ncbi:MAG TPA: UPF0149 family protein [Burkholderiales bacterium]|nr:UPF0149 family protein [Burkholderiales bacterium]
MAVPEPALSPDELDRLERRLGESAFKGEAMRLDELQGLFCAVASSPDRIAPSKWLRLALGEEPDYESAEQMNDVVALLTRFQAQVARDLAADEPLSLILYHAAPGELPECADWCLGYLRGAALSVPDWRAAMGEEDFQELLGPMLALSGVARDEARENNRRWLSAREERELYSACRQDLPHAVKRISRYWRARRAER